MEKEDAPPFKVGDRVIAVSTGKTIYPVVVGNEYEIEYSWDDGTCGVKGNRRVQKNKLFVLANDRQYDPATAKHGDVYESAFHQSYPIAILIKSGRAWIASDEEQARSYVDEDSGSCGHSPSSTCGKFLYNVFDKESATTDCAEEVDAVEELYSLLQEFDNKEEATMPVTITTTTTFPKGSVPDVVKIDGTEFNDSVKDSGMVDLIRMANAEIETLAKEAKDSGSKHMANQVKEAKVIRAELVRLLDERE